MAYGNKDDTVSFVTYIIHKSNEFIASVTIVFSFETEERGFEYLGLVAVRLFFVWTFSGQALALFWTVASCRHELIHRMPVVQRRCSWMGLVPAAVPLSTLLLYRLAWRHDDLSSQNRWVTSDVVSHMQCMWGPIYCFVQAAEFNVTRAHAGWLDDQFSSECTSTSCFLIVRDDWWKMFKWLEALANAKHRALFVLHPLTLEARTVISFWPLRQTWW